jgi:hypothetical protein
MNYLEFVGDVYLPQPCIVDLGQTQGIVCNLEHPITQSERGYPSKINLKADKNYLTSSFSDSLIAVCLANNHIMDYQEQGFLDTLTSLRNAGVGYYGAGYLSDNCNNPLLLDIDGSIVALMGYVCPSTSAIFATDSQPGVRAIDIDIIQQDIALAKSQGADRIVVSLHWGCEQVVLPKLEDVLTAHAILGTGADLIIGHHSHCIQPFEKKGGGYIFYGLGNCIMPDLDVPSYYNEAGEPTSRFICKQANWNKTSLAVRYSPADGQVTASVLAFSDNRLFRTKKSPMKHHRNLGNLSNYDKQFKRSFFVGKLKDAFANYLSRPKLPEIRHVKLMLSMYHSKEYK